MAWWRRVYDLRMADFDVHVYHHFDGGPDEGPDARLDQLLALAEEQGVKMSQLSDAVDALQGRITEDVTHLLDLLTASQAAEAAALANDAADAQTIADRTAERDAALADAEATVARITAIDPVADFPGVPDEPPVEEPPVA